ncbi:hypothetical protein M2448_001200 [Dysgonomonas sp. PF1-14]|uniref:hypothetical protein n=1 Tax=Dysgonomonas sp. PF1-14 TaxID=2940630 RepID=UPI0024763E89|nr:hypothetical protein [Dysgonomonas sp. PF1-14]MDH6308276.1 hypothetical protein [Dysgonomonas sp. PF1-14]
MNGRNKTFGILLLSIVIFLLPVLCSNAQEKFRVMFYNAENLYDTKDIPTPMTTT